MPLLLRIILRPRETVEALAARPLWLSSFCILALFGVFLFVLNYHLLVDETLRHLPPGASQEDKAYIAEWAGAEIVLRGAFLPIRLFIGWGVFALALMYGCRAATPPKPIRFSQSFSLVVHVQVFLMLGQMIGSIASHLSPESHRYGTTPFSIAFFLPRDVDYVSHLLLNSVNPFMLWSIGVLSLGISCVCGFGGRTSLFVVGLVTLVSVMFNTSVIKLLIEALYLLV
jgi:hypothetical protein